jgi:hypothetical protein
LNQVEKYTKKENNRDVNGTVEGETITESSSSESGYEMGIPLFNEEKESEKLYPGDVVEYYEWPGTVGNADWLRKAEVVKVLVKESDGENENYLYLNNTGHLFSDDQCKRIRTSEGNDPVSNKYRYIYQFDVSPFDEVQNNVNYADSRLVQSLKGIMDEGTERLKSRAKECGYGDNFIESNRKEKGVASRTMFTESEIKEVENAKKRPGVSENHGGK